MLSPESPQAFSNDRAPGSTTRPCSAVDSRFDPPEDDFDLVDTRLGVQKGEGRRTERAIMALQPCVGDRLIAEDILGMNADPGQPICAIGLRGSQAQAFSLPVRVTGSDHDILPEGCCEKRGLTGQSQRTIKRFFPGIGHRKRLLNPVCFSGPVQCPKPESNPHPSSRPRAHPFTRIPE